MSTQLDRVSLLFQQSRWTLAEEEIRKNLQDEPGNPHWHGLLAIALAHQNKIKDAQENAKQAVELAPDWSFTHYTRSVVAFQADELNNAATAIGEAIRLEPEDADYWSLLSQVRLGQSRWSEALDAADKGLEQDPEHTTCKNLRSRSLLMMGRREEALLTAESNLAADPEDSFSHATQGWTLLESGKREAALEHFKEALRIDPSNEWAREGVVAALKARNIFYYGFLKYLLWMAKLPSRMQWGLILGGYFLNRILGSVAEKNPEHEWWINPVRIVYVLFVLITWTADPFFNLLLRLNRYGRLVLSEEQIRASNWFGGFLLAGILFLGASILSASFLLPAVIMGTMLFPVSILFRIPENRRKGFLLYTLGCGVLGVAGCALFLAAEIAGLENLSVIGVALAALGGLGAILSTWVYNFLAARSK